MTRTALRTVAAALLALTASCSNEVTSPLARVDGSASSVKGGTGGGGITLSVSPATATLAPAATQQLTATLRNPAGHAVPSDRPTTWASSDESVATVGSDGVVTGVSAGTATITAAAGPISGSAVITVQNPADASLRVQVWNGPGPSRNATVTLAFANGTTASTRTDDQGTAYFTDQLVGVPVIISATSESGDQVATLAAQFVHGDNSYFVLVLPPPPSGRVEGRILAAHVSVVNAHGTLVWDGDVSGSYFLDLPLGSYTLLFSQMGYFDQTFAVTLKNNDDIFHDVELVAAPSGDARVAVVVSDASGNRVEGARVTLTYEAGSTSAVTSESGFLIFERQVAGVPATVTVRGRDGSTISQDVPAGFFSGTMVFRLTLP